MVDGHTPAKGTEYKPNTLDNMFFAVYVLIYIGTGNIKASLENAKIRALHMAKMWYFLLFIPGKV